MHVCTVAMYCNIMALIIVGHIQGHTYVWNALISCNVHSRIHFLNLRAGKGDRCIPDDQGHTYVWNALISAMFPGICSTSIKESGDLSTIL